MPKNLGQRNTNSAERAAIIRLLSEGRSPSKIAEFFNCSRTTVYNIQASYNKTGNFDDAPRSGRPSKMDERSLRHLDRIVKSNRREILGNITTSLNTFLTSPVCTRTVQRTLHNTLQYYARHAVKKPYLKEVHIQNRFTYAKANSRLSLEDFHSVIWTDESSIELGKDSSNPLVWRRPDEKYWKECLLPTFKSGRQSIMVWAGIAYNRRTALIFLDKNERNGEAYTRNILAGPLWDFYLELSEERGWIKVMEDGAPIHTCGTAKNFRSTHLIDVFEHPAQSPDMNPIEHLWYLLKRALSKRLQKPKNLEELKGALLEEWEKIDISIINSLINSMPNRIQALKEAKGGSTKY
ncbi:Tc1-like transporase [Pyrrhoderma noxium]|uniref:Tc1-like transporase n=1 Tax=Pyrrhoderma noxium TaxID=2282107 RepID=A0A286UPS1_9AGAM|nr:Tc1-like transporase [Pyrrhoderma noxium]